MAASIRRNKKPRLWRGARSREPFQKTQYYIEAQAKERAPDIPESVQGSVAHPSPQTSNAATASDRLPPNYTKSTGGGLVMTCVTGVCVATNFQSN